MTDCPVPEALVEDAIDLVLTQYRESPRFLGLARGLLDQPAVTAETVCKILDHFDIDNASGDQLTIIGKWLGWPRCHCAGRRRKVFGFKCEPLHLVYLVDEDGTPVIECPPGPPPEPLMLAANPIMTTTAGEPYEGFVLEASGGLPPYSFSVFAGSLPPGITLDPETGVVAGVPTEVGFYPDIVLRVMDSVTETAHLAVFQIAVYGAPEDLGRLLFNDPGKSMFIGQLV